MKEITSESVRANMQLPPDMKAAYDKIIKAGLKVMFDPKTQDQTIEFMRGEGDMGQKVGEGVAAVMVLLFKESNETMPPQLVIPAGIELVVHAADVARNGGMDMTDNDIAEAMGVMVETVMKQFGVDPAQLQTANSGLQPQGV